ncbi:MAG: hypothetical protein JWM28_2862, partial [Chitinophagaceae bacterium]|nr:hypothetical protein [Chitinophagaceae bacterium]
MQPGNQLIHFFFCIVNRKGSPGSTGNTKTLHQGLCTMMARSDCNATVIQQNPNILGMYFIYHKGNHAYLFFRLTNNS